MRKPGILVSFADRPIRKFGHREPCCPNSTTFFPHLPHQRRYQMTEPWRNVVSPEQGRRLHHLTKHSPRIDVGLLTKRRTGSSLPMTTFPYKRQTLAASTIVIPALHKPSASAPSSIKSARFVSRISSNTANHQPSMTSLTDLSSHNLFNVSGYIALVTG